MIALAIIAIGPALRVHGASPHRPTRRRDTGRAMNRALVAAVKRRMSLYGLALEDAVAFVSVRHGIARDTIWRAWAER